MSNHTDRASNLRYNGHWFDSRQPNKKTLIRITFSAKLTILTVALATSPTDELIIRAPTDLDLLY